MFWAIIKEVYEELINKNFSEKESLEKACYNSVEMLRNWSQEQIREFTYYDCSGIQTLLTDKLNVSYIEEHQRQLNNSYYFVRPHFRLSKENKLSYTKSDDKHITAQHILAALILQEEPIKINYRDIPFNLNDINLKLKNKTSEHVLEQTHNNKGTYIENGIGINRRADLLFELETPNLTFGKGFVFEIYNTESLDSIKEKSKDWASAGYTLIGISIKDFDFEEFGLRKEPKFILHRLFDDLNLYLELLKKIKYNEPLIDNFNKNVKEMEFKMFLWKSGRHNYNLEKGEKIDSMLLYSLSKEIKNFKGKKLLILTCYDYRNQLFDLKIWDTNPLFNKIDNLLIINKLLKLEYAFFDSYENEISIKLNSYSKLKILDFEEIKNAN